MTHIQYVKAAYPPSILLHVTTWGSQLAHCRGEVNDCQKKPHNAVSTRLINSLQLIHCFLNIKSFISTVFLLASAVPSIVMGKEEHAVSGKHFIKQV